MSLARGGNRDLSPAIAQWSTVQSVASGNDNQPTGQVVVRQAVTSADVGTVNGGAEASLGDRLFWWVPLRITPYGTIGLRTGSTVSHPIVEANIKTAGRFGVVV